MKHYRVSPQGVQSYVVTAPSIWHVVAYTRHWPRVTIRRVVDVCHMGINAWVTAGYEHGPQPWYTPEFAASLHCRPH